MTKIGKSLIWSPHPDDDIIGYRIYLIEKGSKHTAVGSVATFSNDHSFEISSNGQYFVTAVDVAGNESPQSKIILFSE